MTTSGYAFHFLNYNGVESSSYGGVLPDPIELEISYPIIDGKVVEVTATSGHEQYMIVEPGDYPVTEDQRQKRRGSVRSK